MSNKILVVDDDPGIVRLITMMVNRVHTTIPAYSGQEALEKHATMELDLILLDLAMPDIDGYTVLRRIRQREADSNIPYTPVVFLTAHVKSVFNDSDLQQQVDGIITKPITSQKLLAELARILG